MSGKEPTDFAGNKPNAEESKKGSSLDPWPEIDRDIKKTITDDKPTTPDQTSDDNETTRPVRTTKTLNQATSRVTDAIIIAPFRADSSDGLIPK